MEGLPKLPGLDFSNKLKTRHHVSHCFDYHNGYTHVRPPLTAIGNEPPTEQSVAFLESEDAILYDPVLTYGRVKADPPMAFRPKYVLYDKMTLTFKAFFKQHVTESPKEHYRIRHVNILYFLEDDSITVMEPPIRNSGITHGRLIRRGKIAKNTSGEVYTWKDLNIGMDLDLNGIVFHITDCDQFTKDFMASQGVELNDVECSPGDPVTIESQAARIPCKPASKKTPDDKLRRFLAFQGKVLNFDCILDESDRPSGEVMTYQMLYFLEDDTVSIKELKENREGRDRFPMMLSRQKLPKNWKCRPLDYPSIFLERGEDEIQEYYTPQDFRVGETIYVYGRRFLLLDCDKFTRNYFENVLRIPQKEKLLIKFPEKKMAKRPIPDYLGLGTPEDSLTSCFGLILKPPKKDVIKYLLNTNKFLRYGCVLDSAHPEDSIRKFILSYSLADDQIKIVEPPIRNSGIWGGKYLLPMRVKRPGCNPNVPEYYGPKDFYIGATLEIFDHRFKIVSVDLYVWKFMQQNPEFFSPEAIESVRQFFEEEEKKKSKVVVYKDCKDVDLGNRNCECPDPVPALEKNLQDIMVHDDVNNRPIENIEQKVRDEHPADDAKACPYEVQPAEEECGLII